MDLQIFGEQPPGTSDDGERMLHAIRAQVTKALADWHDTALRIPSAHRHGHWIGPANAAYVRSLVELTSFSNNVVAALDDAEIQLARAVASWGAHV